MPEGADKRTSRVAQGRHKQMQPHPLAADRRRGRAKVDLQLLARRCFKPQAGSRFGLQCLAQRRCRALHRAQRHGQPMLTQQVLAHHIAVAAVLPEALLQPLLEPIEPPLAPRWANRRPVARRQITLHRVPAAPHLAGYPLAPPTQFVQVHHRRHLVRCQHPLPPRIQPPRRALPQQRSCHSSLLPVLSEGVNFDVARGSVFHVAR